MKLVPVALLYLSSVTFLGASAVRLDVASELKKRWNVRVLSRIRRELRAPSKPYAQEVNSSIRSPFIRTENMKDPLNLQDSTPSAHMRVKRHRPSTDNLVKVGCRFGTCTVQNLAHVLYHYTDKQKDNAAPSRKMSSQGYGRRRRAVPDSRALFQVIEGKLRPLWLRGSSSSSRTSEKGQEQVRRNADAPQSSLKRAHAQLAFLRT
ncbi:pro-adrenomedullin [Microcaecilia unicolor]|uniref:Pro-adrenomedullin n=1 Tax=Microcaecilia unicolor TaxID=1415580 RepID=A0A6P7XQH3_9AMPH|nr:ADM [Microcaecilia unicolor]